MVFDGDHISVVNNHRNARILRNLIAWGRFNLENRWHQDKQQLPSAKKEHFKNNVNLEVNLLTKNPKTFNNWKTLRESNSIVNQPTEVILSTSESYQQIESWKQIQIGIKILIQINKLKNLFQPKSPE